MAPESYRRGLTALVVGVTIVFGINTVWRACWADVERSDFPVYLAAAGAVVDGGNIYEARSARGWHYAYPPPFAIVMVPFTLVPKPVASLAWYLLSLALLAHCLHMCVALARPPGDHSVIPTALRVVPPLLILWPLASGLERGQTTVLMTWLVVATLYWHERRATVAATCLAAAILLRAFPAVLVLYFAWRGHRRLTAWSIAITVLLAVGPPSIVYGWKQNAAYWHRWITEVVSPVVHLGDASAPQDVNDGRDDPFISGNQSLAAVLTRLSWSGAERGAPGKVQSGRARRPVPPGNLRTQSDPGDSKAPLAALAVAALMALTMVAVAPPPQSSIEMWVAAQAVLWMLVAIPLSWAHYFILLLLPLTLVTAIATDRSSPLRHVAAIVLVGFAFLAVVGGLWGPFRFYGPLCWGSLGVWATLVLATAQVRWGQA